ncbi:hypothetical protein Ancab_009735 [Ancistrocladus abbreviatus]
MIYGDEDVESPVASDMRQQRIVPLFTLLDLCFNFKGEVCSLKLLLIQVEQNMPAALSGGGCKICGGVTHLAKDCPSKGGKGSAAPKGEAEQVPRGRVTKLVSGDDLEDDFMMEDKVQQEEGPFYFSIS